MNHILKNTFMVTSKQNGKKGLPTMLYIFISAFTINCLMHLLFFSSWSFYFLSILFAFVCHLIDFLIFTFSIAYYFITRKKIYGFWIILFLGFISLIALGFVILFILGWNHGDPAKQIQ